MLPPNNLGPDELGVFVNETLFRDMIGSLMYLIASRPNIQFSICLRARYQANPKESHLVVVKRIFRYLKETLNLGLHLKAYSDSDYAGCNLDRKSTSGTYQILGGKLVPIFCDNTSAINNPVLHSRTKHIDIRYHFIKDHILKGDIEFHFVPIDLQLADIFTKPLAEPSFTRLVAELGYLKEFWYTLEVDEATKNITFLLSSFEKPLSFTQEEFISTTGLPVCENVVPTPLKETTVHGDDDTDKSLSGTTVQPITQPKAPTDLKLNNNKIPPFPKQKSSYKVRVILPKKQVTAKEPVAIADASKSLGAFESIEEQVNHPKTAEAEKSDPLGPLHEEMHILNTKIDKLESSITKKVVDQSSMPLVITNSLRENLHGLLSEALKNTLPQLIKDFIKQSVSKSIEEKLSLCVAQVQRTKQSHQNQDGKISQSKKIFKKANAKGEKWEKNNPESPAQEKNAQNPDPTQKEQKSKDDYMTNIQGEHSTLKKLQLTEITKMSFYQFSEYLTQTTSSIFSPTPPKEPTPLRDESKEKGIATRALETNIKAQAQKIAEYEAKRTKMLKEYNDCINQRADELPIMKISYSDATMRITRGNDPLNVVIHDKFILTTLGLVSGLSNKVGFLRVSLVPSTKTCGELDIRSASCEKLEESLKMIMNPANIKAQAQKIAEYEAKRTKMLKEYNDCINQRADELPIRKISYSSSNDATMRITRGNDPLNVVIHDKFILTTLGLVISQVKKLGVPPPTELSTFGILVDDKKRKRSSLQEAFLKENIVVDGMHRNLALPLGVKGRRGLVIRKPESGIFYYNGNFDLVFKESQSSI
nr:hypothetical protein [Tanacetum cinerariifolium]